MALIPGIMVESDLDTTKVVKVFGLGVSVFADRKMKVSFDDNAEKVKRQFIDEILKPELRCIFNESHVETWVEGSKFGDNMQVGDYESIRFESELWDDIQNARRFLDRACSGFLHNLGLDGVLGIQSYITGYMEKLVDEKKDELGDNNDGIDNNDDSDDENSEIQDKDGMHGESEGDDVIEKFDYKNLCINDDIDYKDCISDDECDPGASGSGSIQTFQIFIKSLLGLSLTVKPSANDTVKDLINLLLEKTYETCQGVDLDLFTAEQTKWESGKFGLNYKGKTLEEERTLSEYGVEKGSTLYMVLKMSGEGKRPAAAVAKKSKEEKTEEAITQYKETMLLLATRAGNPICAETGRQCEALFEQVEGGSDTVVSDALAGLSILELQKLQGSFTSNGEDTRVKALAKAIFGAATSEIVAMKANMAAAEKAAEQVTTICFYTQFMTEAGGFEWDKYRKAVTKAMTDIAEDRGYEAGRNEAANSVA